MLPTPSEPGRAVPWRPNSLPQSRVATPAAGQVFSYFEKSRAPHHRIRIYPGRRDDTKVAVYDELRPRVGLLGNSGFFYAEAPCLFGWLPSTPSSSGHRVSPPAGGCGLFPEPRKSRLAGCPRTGRGRPRHPACQPAISIERTTLGYRLDPVGVGREAVQAHPVVRCHTRPATTAPPR